MVNRQRIRKKGILSQEFQRMACPVETAHRYSLAPKVNGLLGGNHPFHGAPMVSDAIALHKKETPIFRGLDLSRLVSIRLFKLAVQGNLAR